MSLIDLSCLCIFLVFAPLSETRVLILQDYVDEPFVLNHGGSSINEGMAPKQEAISIGSHYRPKKMRSSKRATLEYGRYIYNLDDSEDLKELRSKISELEKPLRNGPISYNHVDFNDWKSIESARIGDLLILSGTPLHFCNGEDCKEDRKMFRKFDDHKDWNHKKKALKFIKRYKIVDNRHQLPKKHKHTKYDSSEKKNKNKKTSRQVKKKKQNDSSESMDSEKRSSESWESDKKYSSRESREFMKKPNKQQVSIEDWTDESRSIERSIESSVQSSDESSVESSVESSIESSVEKTPNIKKKNKKKNDEPSGETERKAMNVEDDYFMQGNKIFHSKDRKANKKHDDTKRRRLEHFMPKRYHWRPEDIHELGYFWFNGPKGEYPAPKPL